MGGRPIKNNYKKQYRKATKTPAADDQIIEVVKATAGKEALGLVKLMAKNSDISEFNLVKGMRLDIQSIRNILYRLHSSNLATYRMIKDQKKGIYVSYWTLNKAAISQLFSKMHREKIQRFKERLEIETSNINCFFICPSACSRADFTRAVQQSFKCAECGQLLQQEDNARTIDVLREKIREMEAAA
ncbi:hypothetical protein HYU18_05010 [Candidatus Woesearchaeota archaeon]|nr:hypothetical protein [Candidatus Woesearchaeota archaeon]